MRKIVRFALVVLGAALVVDLVEGVLMIWAFRTQNPRALRLVRRYNKYVTNPMAVRFMGRSGDSAVIHHVGRRSGKHYATPVLAHRSDREVVIPLPYGTEVDWLRNVLAEGRAVLDSDGRTFAIDEPEVVDVDEVTDLLSASMRRTVRTHDTRQALHARASGIHTPVPA